MTLRRLAAGELGSDAAARASAHLAGCARCRATASAQEAERRVLAETLPFEAFAAGVAERLVAGPAPRSARPAWRRVLPLALAAGVALGVALPLLGRLSQERGGLGRGEDGTRIKGGAAATLHLRQAEGSRPLAPGEGIPGGGALRLELAPGGHRFAAAALVDEDGPALLQAGPAAGPGPAFEWTGRRGRLVVVFDDVPVDGAALLGRLARGGVGAASPGGQAEVVVLPLARSGP
jgi:hypothetical protein